MLTHAVKDLQERLTKEKSELLELIKDNNKNHSEILQPFPEKIHKMVKYIAHTQKGIQDLQEKYCKEADKLVLERIKNVHLLMKYIFPIAELQPKSDDDSMTKSTVSALADASRTTYVGGRWVYSDNSGEVQYQIVEPTLPGNGDCSAYLISVASNKEEIPGPIAGRRDPAYTISAALGHTTQFLNLLSSFLDVTLPEKLCYSVFNGNELGEHTFNKLVAKLNTNILYLCLSQAIDPDLLHPKQTLRNLTLLFNPVITRLGRIGPFEVNQELLQAANDGSQFEDHSDDSDSSKDFSDNDNDIGGDWESVSSFPYLEMNVPTRVSQSSTTNVQSFCSNTIISPPQTTTSLAGGLMSAAASVASFWRAATGQSEKK